MNILLYQSCQVMCQQFNIHTLLYKYPCQTLKDLSDSLGVKESTVSKHLKSMGLIYQLGNWLPHDLKERDIQMQLSMCKLLLQWHEGKP